MAVQLKLEGTDGSLQIEFDGRNWGKCHLQTEGRAYLGAESRRYLIQHLLLRLEDPASEPIGKVGGRPVKWVLSLADGESILYVSAEDSNRVLRWQNARAEWIGSLKVSPDQWRQWRQQLEALREQPKHGA